MSVNRIYRHSLALLTDLYQLTMAYGYWKLGREEEEAAFHLFFRTNAFGGGYTVAAGLAYVLDFLRNLRFEEDDLATSSPPSPETTAKRSSIEEISHSSRPTGLQLRYRRSCPRVRWSFRTSRCSG